VEQATGCAVAVTQDAGLHVPSTVLMAAPDRPGHIIRIHPKAPAGVDYYAASNSRPAGKPVKMGGGGVVFS